MKVPITQSKDWQQLQETLGERSFFLTGKNHQFLAILKHARIGNYLYCPYGPVLESKSDLSEALAALSKLAREQSAIFIRIEPMLALTPDFLRQTAKTHGLSVEKSKDLSPKDTWVLDLSPDQPAIIANFSQGTRTRYNTYAKKGLVVERTTDKNAIQVLVDLQNKLFEKKHLHAYGASYLKAELEQPFASLYLVKYVESKDQTRPSDTKAAKAKDTSENTKAYPADGQVLAASLFFDYAGTRYYMQSAADGDFKRLPATVALLTTAIFDAKEQGIKEFDFWGIAPDGAPEDHPWAGFTEFKKSFGGSPRHYAGTYDLVLSPARYRLYRSTRSLGKIFRAS